MTEQDNNNTHQASNQSAKSPIPNPGQPNGSAPGKSVQESASDKRAPNESSVANYGFDFNIGTWKGAEYEPKQSSVGGAQEDPRSKVTDVLNERAARGNGNVPSRS